MPDNIQMARQGTSYTESVASTGNTRQTVTVDATGGTFTLTYAAQTTGAVAEAAVAATVQTALEALSNIAPGDVAVTGSAGGPWTVEFTGAFAGTSVTAMTASGASLTGGAATAVVAVAAVGFNSAISLSWGTGAGAQREIVYAPTATRSAPLAKEIANGNIVETATAVTSKPARPVGMDRARMSRRLIVAPSNGDTLTYSSATKRWVPENGK